VFLISEDWNTNVVVREAKCECTRGCMFDRSQKNAKEEEEIEHYRSYVWDLRD
jgi:hypothetical protein